MASEKIAPAKENRGHASLERRLARKELARRFWLLVKIDFLIIAIFLCALILRSETIARKLDFDYSMPAGLTLTHSDTRPEGFELERHIAGAVGQNQEAIRRLYFKNGIDDDMFLESLRGLSYIHAFKWPSKAGYGILTFSFYEAIAIFENAFIALLVLEALGLLGSAIKIRESIRATLKPIYDLTLAAAESVNRGAGIKAPLYGGELSGTIDTLNTITENDLDRRIVIANEREELKGLAQAINSMLDRLDAAYSSQLRFVSDASHELRTPISVIQGYANMLDRWGKNDTETLQESIDAIKSEASGMQDLVEQLLFLARSDNRSIALNIETVGVSSLADEVFRETGMIDNAHEYKSNFTEGLFVRGDIQLLKQALRIFVDNAIKYTPSGGMITISTESTDGFVRISVTDNGLGIPPGDLEKIFDRFFRSDESRTRETGGTGLGLSIAKWIIDRHGGYVEVVSRIDIGTKIAAALPEYKMQ